MLPEYSSEVGHCYDAIGSWYHEIGRMEEAKDYLIRAERIFSVTEAECSYVLNQVKSRLSRIMCSLRY